MHPRLVAGSWVGFNDSRVTMRSNYWGEGARNALPVVGDFFQKSLASRLIDGAVEFPFARPSDSIWEPFFDAAKDWFGDVFKGLFGESARPPPGRDIVREAPQREEAQRDRDRLYESQEQSIPDRQRERERLLEWLRQKREQYEREDRGRD
jgi:penicillin-binding protein 1A